DRQLAPGDYYVAVTGAGNRYLHPNLENSGFAGATGDYTLQATATVLDTSAGLGVLAVDASSFVVRVELTGDPDDPSTLLSDGTVQLTDNTGAPVMIAWWQSNYTTSAHELQIVPNKALAPGQYNLWLAGQDMGGPFTGAVNLTVQLDHGEGSSAD